MQASKKGGGGFVGWGAGAIVLLHRSIVRVRAFVSTPKRQNPSLILSIPASHLFCDDPAFNYSPRACVNESGMSRVPPGAPELASTTLTVWLSCEIIGDAG